MNSRSNPGSIITAPIEEYEVEYLVTTMELMLLAHQEQIRGIYKNINYKHLVNQFKAILVREAIIRTQGNQVMASQVLGINRGTFRKILEEVKFEDGLKELDPTRGRPKVQSYKQNIK